LTDLAHEHLFIPRQDYNREIKIKINKNKNNNKKFHILFFLFFFFGRINRHRKLNFPKTLFEIGEEKGQRFVNPSTRY
jgi:hypothetical protein